MIDVEFYSFLLIDLTNEQPERGYRDKSLSSVVLNKMERIYRLGLLNLLPLRKLFQTVSAQRVNIFCICLTQL